MTTASASRTAVASDHASDGDAAVERPVTVHNCSRLGRTANPPRFSLGDLFRFGRWR